MLRNKKNIRKVFLGILYLFAIIGLFFSFVFVAMQFGWLNVKGSISQRNSYFNVKSSSDSIGPVDNYYSNTSNITYDWNKSDQWILMKEVFTRDQEIINKAASDAGVSPRLILSGVIGEQFRFFNSRREAFKSYFEPLKILASLSKISYGIAGLKPKTVTQIEDHLKDPNSPYYLGPDMEHIADYDSSITDIDGERMNRITDTKNPYYSYFYVGLYMRQIEAQWEKGGYNIDNRPEILATLYNLGFFYSTPKDNPQAGGADIVINGTDYTYGDIANLFYYSDELSDIFPRDVQ